MGDLTDLAALFFADANQDRRKDLLAPSQCDLREEVRLSDGELHTGRIAHYQTLIWQYVGPDKIGRPHYQQEALVRHQHPRYPALSEPTPKAVK
jgi:hypothetical protein